MAGHFDLGHDDDVPLGGVSDDLADVGGREILPLARRRIERADLGELRIAGDFEPPAGVVGQVELEDVQFVARHFVDEAKHHGFPKKWRLTSISKPRQGKRGASAMSPAAMARRPALSVTSWRSVCAP